MTDAQRERDQKYPHSLHAGLCWVWTDEAGAGRLLDSGLAHTVQGQHPVAIDPRSGYHVVTVAEGDFLEARNLADGHEPGITTEVMADHTADRKARQET